MKRVILFVSFAILIFLTLPFWFFLNRNLAYYAYKEVTYETIVERIIDSEKNPEKIAILLEKYLFHTLFAPSEASVIDKDVYNDLFRAIAWCDQSSWALGTFLGRIGIDSRMIMTRNPEGISNHTVLEALIDNKWEMFDPYFGMFFRDDQGQIVSYKDICNEPSLFYLSPEMKMLEKINPKKYVYIKEYFTRNIFYSKVTEPTIWRNPVHKKDFKRRIITNTLNFYINTFGRYFSNFYQDIYLKYFSPTPEIQRIYFKARNYHLYNRYELAVSSYKRLIANFHDDPILEKALFQLALLYHNNKNLESSIDTLQILLQKYPDTKWRRIAYYFLGYNYELLKNYDLAKKYYWRGISLYNELDQNGLEPTELKIVKRLYKLLYEHY